MKTKAEKLLERFADLYGETQLVGSMIPDGMKLWREYWIYTGQHMILSDEGWEQAEDALDSYVESVDGFENIHDAIHDEVNWRFGTKKYPRIFPRKEQPK